MLGFLIGRFDPIIEKPDGQGHMAEPRDDVPMKINRIQFDMPHGVEQGDPPRL